MNTIVLELRKRELKIASIYDPVPTGSLSLGQNSSLTIKQQKLLKPTHKLDQNCSSCQVRLAGRRTWHKAVSEEDEQRWLVGWLVVDWKERKKERKKERERESGSGSGSRKKLVERR